jgi:ComF family protein
MSCSGVLRCGQCQQHPPAFDYASTGYHYRFPLDRWLMQCKDRYSAMWHDRLQRLAGDAFIAPSIVPDAIACIPARRHKRFKRGFNLSYSLACTLAQNLNRPLIHVFSLRPGLDQRGLSVPERHRNLRHSLQLDMPRWQQAQQQLDLQHVLLVDDVMTSGATFERAARLLKQQGVKLVGCWALARTLKAP